MTRKTNLIEKIKIKWMRLMCFLMEVFDIQY